MYCVSDMKEDNAIKDNDPMPFQIFYYLQQSLNLECCHILRAAMKTCFHLNRL